MQARVPSSRKSLFLSEDASSVSVDQSRKEDWLLEHSNIDDLLTENKETVVKVVIVHPNGNVVISTPADKQSKHVFEKLESSGKWCFPHPSLREKLPSVLQRAYHQNFSNTDSVLKGIELDQLAGFSSKLVLEEIRIICPLWNASIHGAYGNLSINSVALCSLVAPRVTNASMSASEIFFNPIAVQNSWKIKPLPKPVGTTAKTSLPSHRALTTSFCSREIKLN